MNSFILIPLCVVLWIFTLARLWTILRQIDTVILNIWAILFFFAITLTFMVAEFAAFFNAHTLPNLSLLVHNSAFLVSQYFGMAAILAGMDIPTARRIARWMRLLLGVALLVLSLLYIFFVSQAQSTSVFAPGSLAEVIFRLTVCFFGVILCIVLAATQVVYFPAKKFILIRLRATLMLLCTCSGTTYILIRAVMFASYLWPFLSSPALAPLAYGVLVCATILFLSIFLSNRLYARLVFLWRNIESWWAFQDLKRLVDRLLPLCPLIGNIPVENPGFLAFLRDPEHHLYHAVVVILDSKLMLAHFLTEGMKPGTHPMWEGEDDLLREAMRLNQALQAANSSNEFSDVVNTYRRVSRDLFASQKNTPAGAS